MLCFQEQNHTCWVTAKCVGAWVCAHVPYTETARRRSVLFTRYPNQEKEVSASKEGNVVKFLSPPIAAIMNSTWHMSKSPLSLSWKASLFWKKKWGAEWNACEEVSARTEVVFSETQHEHLLISAQRASTWTLFTKLRGSKWVFLADVDIWFLFVDY